MFTPNTDMDMKNKPLFVCFSPQAIRVFFMLRALSLQLRGEPETQLPLTRPEDLIKTDDVLDLSESCALLEKEI